MSNRDEPILPSISLILSMVKDHKMEKDEACRLMQIHLDQATLASDRFMDLKHYSSMALHGILASSKVHFDASENCRDIALRSIRYASALLDELEKRKG